MKIGVFIPCYKLDDYLDAVVNNYSQWNDLLVLRKDFKKHGQVNVRNEGLQKLRDCDYVWTVDADEIILPEEQEKIIKEVVDGKYNSVLLPPIDYVDENYIYEPREGHKAVVLLNPKEVKFYDTRCVTNNKSLWSDNYVIHHLGFTFPREKMKWKTENYWNTGNPKEATQIMNRPKIKYNTPKLVKDILRKVKNVNTK